MIAFIGLGNVGVRYKDTKLRVNLELDKSYKEKQDYILLEKDGNLYI